MNLAGGWTKFRPVTEEDIAVFNEAMEGFVGVSYEPLIVATQIVAGTNYKFVCNATSATNPPREYLAQVVIFRPLPNTGEKPVIVHISELN